LLIQVIQEVKLKKIEISIDEGKSWNDAEIIRKHDKLDNSSKNWAWVVWEFNINETYLKKKENIRIYCRTQCENGDTQPKTVFNPNLYLYNGWHNVILKRSDDE